MPDAGAFPRKRVNIGLGAAEPLLAVDLRLRAVRLDKDEGCEQGVLHFDWPDGQVAFETICGLDEAAAFTVGALYRFAIAPAPAKTKGAP